MNPKISIQATEVTENTEMKRLPEYLPPRLTGRHNKVGNRWFFLCALCALCALCGQIIFPL